VQPQLAATKSTTDWITEFDALDPTYMLSPFELTLFGRLSTELLGMVAQYHSNRDLATAAQTSRKPRELVEHKLYSNVIIPYRHIYDDDEGEEEQMMSNGEYTL
jgi:hypothetical protein